MNTAKDLEKAVELLPKAELMQFRAWFTEFDAENWDEKIKKHIDSGKLDQLGKNALLAHSANKTSEI